MGFWQLGGLGKVAGIGGIALGVVVLLIRPMIDHSNSLPEPLRGWLLLTIAIGAIVIGLFGMVVWLFGSGSQVARTKGDNSEAVNIDHTSYGRGDQHARTSGKGSPAINERSKR